MRDARVYAPLLDRPVTRLVGGDHFTRHRGGQEYEHNFFEYMHGWLQMLVALYCVSSDRTNAKTIYRWSGNMECPSPIGFRVAWRDPQIQAGDDLQCNENVNVRYVKVAQCSDPVATQ